MVFNESGVCNMKHKKLFWILGSILVCITGFVFIPKLIVKHANRLYKKYLTEIDFDNLHYEVVKTKKEGEENEA